MGRLLVAGIAAAVAVLLGASTASAAVEAGDDCVANAVEANRTMVPWNSGSFSMNRVVGEQVLGEGHSRGVITGWKVRVGPGQDPLPQRLETYDVLNEKEEARKEAETPFEMVGPGESFFATRIPVQSGAHLGLYGPEGTFACNTGESVVTGTFKGSAAVGEIRTITGLIGFRTPVTVNVERDEDGDGYGDETQDTCTRSAALHTDCPAVRVSIGESAVKQRAILVKVRTSSEAPVQVFGQVSWQVRQPGQGAQPSRKGDRGLTVGLSAGGPRTVPGTTYTFRLPLPKSVKRRLGRLTPQQALRAKITARATDLVGRVSESKRTVKLPGRER